MRSEQRAVAIKATAPSSCTTSREQDPDPWRRRDDARVDQIVAFLAIAGRSTRRELEVALWLPSGGGTFDRPLALAMDRGLVARVKRGSYEMTPKAQSQPLPSLPELRISLCSQNA